MAMEIAATGLCMANCKMLSKFATETLEVEGRNAGQSDRQMRGRCRLRVRRDGDEGMARGRWDLRWDHHWD